MTGRAKVWLGAAALFSAGNLAGVGFAVAAGEWPHAGLHVALGLIAAWVTWRLAERARPRDPGSDVAASGRLEQLQQSVDAVALEVERIGEGQRFDAKLRAAQAEQQR